jgi:hypothetical protein
MQGIEGELDTIHAAFLHSSPNRVRSFEPGSFGYYQSRSKEGKFSVRETEFGQSYGMYRPAEEDTNYWRIGHLLFPCFAMPPGASTLGEDARFLAYVPMDDHNTLEWGVGRRSPGAQSLGSFGREYIPNGSGWFERFRIEQDLGTTDQMIIRTRRHYIAAAKALRDQGITPPGVDQPELYRQRFGQVILPRDADWWEATKELRERFDATEPLRAEATT